MPSLSPLGVDVAAQLRLREGYELSQQTHWGSFGEGKAQSEYDARCSEDSQCPPFFIYQDRPGGIAEIRQAQLPILPTRSGQFRDVQPGCGCVDGRVGRGLVVALACCGCGGRVAHNPTS